MADVPQSDQMRVKGSGRRKVALPPGRSQLDWVRNSSRLQQPRQRSITVSELKKHNKRNDAWLAINGVVFDVTPYIEYHPGGIPMILAGAGKDATNLFSKYHAWVNPHFMLSRCILGPLIADESSTTETDQGKDNNLKDEDEDKNNKSSNKSKQKKNNSSSPNSDLGITEDFDNLNFAEIQE